MRKIGVSESETLLISEHGKDQVTDRDVSDEEIIETYNNPDVTYPQKGKPNRMNFEKTIGKKKLKIAVQMCKNSPNILVTAYYK